MSHGPCLDVEPPDDERLDDEVPDDDRLDDEVPDDDRLDDEVDPLDPVTPPVQGAPLSTKVVGEGFDPFQEPLNPKAVLPPVGMVPLYAALVTVTCAPDWDRVPFHSWVTVWPAVNDQVSVQPFTGSPRLVLVTLAPNPPDQELETA